MTLRIGCTGHQHLPAATRLAVAAEITRLLANMGRDPFVGFSSLADGADQVFALATLAAGGDLHAIIPSGGYEQTFTSESARRSYAALLSLADETTTLAFSEPTEEAFLSAGHEVVRRSEILIAVWDGKAAAGKGGTGDVVSYARMQGVDVRVVWPPGATRN